MNLQFPSWSGFTTGTRASLLALALAASSLYAADTDTNAPPPPPPPLTPQQMFEGGTNAYSNWIELGVGGIFTSGNSAEFRRQHQISGGAFGGIEDFHYQDNLAKDTTLAIDGHAIFDNHDYTVGLSLVKEKLGYVKVSASEYRVWSDGDGGFFSPTSAYFPLPDNDLSLDRGEISFEAGLTLENAPAVTFKYTHRFRDGQKDSTSWGFTHPDGTALVRGLSPSFYDINEHSDAFQLDVSHHIKATEFGAGLSYETGNLDNALKITQFPGEAIQQKATDRQGTSYDMFNVHAFTETWFKKDLMLSSGFSFSDLDNDFSGSRIFGATFDAPYAPNAQSDFGYFGLHGGSRLHEYVLDVNLFSKPISHFTVVPSIRVEKQDWDADSAGFETLGAETPVPFSARSDRGWLEVRERLDLTYNRITNWVFYARGDFTQGQGDLTENGGLGPVNGIGVPTVQWNNDDRTFFQKYAAGVRWYPSRRLTLDVGGYYKLNAYDYSQDVDSTPNNSPNRYPGYLAMQHLETWDGSVRLTFRPLNNLSLAGRYELQYSTIDTKPDPISGLGEVTSSKMTSHIIALDTTWTPWTRLYFQAGGNCVVSDTHTPASDFTQAILTARNNYWTVNVSSGLVVDDKTDLKVGYFFYQADNFVDNANFGVPYGAGAIEHGVSSTISRRLSKNVRLSLRYAFFNYDDDAFGGNRDFQSHVIYSSLQYRF